MISRSDFGWSRDLRLHYAYFKTNEEFQKFQEYHPNSVLVNLWSAMMGSEGETKIGSYREDFKMKASHGIFITYYNLSQEAADAVIENQGMVQVKD